MFRHVEVSVTSSSLISSFDQCLEVRRIRDSDRRFGRLADNMVSSRRQLLPKFVHFNALPVTVGE